jgi:hypothetical protein
MRRQSNCESQTQSHMKTNFFHILSFLTMTIVCLSACSTSIMDKAQVSVKSYLKENLKNSGSYEPISFSQIDTLKQPDISAIKKLELNLSEMEKAALEKTTNEIQRDAYKITHTYYIINSDKDRVKMKIDFYLDKNLNVTGNGDNKGINGDYGVMSGNAYWNYNEYIGNRADAGAEVRLFSLDHLDSRLVSSANADVQGNYKMEKLLPGWYFVIVSSKNVMGCPDSHLKKLEIYSSELNELFRFDMQTLKNQLDKFDTNDSIANSKLYEEGTNSIANYDSYKKKSRDEAEQIIESLPKDFKSQIKLYTGYSNALDYNMVHIEEGKTAIKNTNFGITCIANE